MKVLIYLAACIVNCIALHEADIYVNDWQWWASTISLAATYVACCIHK